MLDNKALVDTNSVPLFCFAYRFHSLALYLIYCFLESLDKRLCLLFETSPISILSFSAEPYLARNFPAKNVAAAAGVDGGCHTVHATHAQKSFLRGPLFVQLQVASKFRVFRCKHFEVSNYSF